jgi:hypothetical protein
MAATYSLLEPCQISRAESIRLGNDWNQVHPGAQSLHDLDVKGLKGVTSGADEVQTGVYTKIDLVEAARLLLLEHVGLMLVVEELNDWHPRVAVVHIVAETRCVDNSETD